MKFRKKPVVIDAVQYAGGDQPFPGRCDCALSGLPIVMSDGPQPPHIHTLEGAHRVTPGDWIITGVAGEHYPCKPAIFEATYEPVPDGHESARPKGADSNAKEYNAPMNRTTAHPTDPRPIEAQHRAAREPTHPDVTLIDWLESLRGDVHDTHYRAAVTDIERRIALGEHSAWAKERGR